MLINMMMEMTNDMVYQKINPSLLPYKSVSMPAVFEGTFVHFSVLPQALMFFIHKAFWKSCLGTQYSIVWKTYQMVVPCLMSQGQQKVPVFCFGNF